MKSIDGTSFASSVGERACQKIPKTVARIALLLAGSLIVSVHPPAVALVSVRSDCTWPTAWPKALDEVRHSCRTYGVATGTQETIYEIVFDDRDKFDRLWTALMTVRTPGSPLRLSPIEPPKEGALLSNAKPTVRIYGPPDGVTIAPSEAEKQPWDTEQLMKAGKALRSSPPWPSNIVSASGALPEYVQATEKDGRLEWVPADRDRRDGGFLNRARIDLELVVDGSIIDLNRTPLPDECTIVDRRFAQENAR